MTGGISVLKVLMIDTVPMIYDGIAAVMLNYAENMRRDDLRVDFVANNDVEPSIRARIDRMGSQLHVIEGRNRHPLRYVRALSALIRREGYQVVHAHGNSCTLATEMLAARLGGARVRCAHSHNTSTTNPRIHKLLRPLFEACYTHAFACGEAAGRWLFRDRPFIVLNNGMRLERWRFDPEARAAFRAKLNLGARRAIGHVGHFSIQKNQAFLVEAFAVAHAQNPSIALVLVGDGPLRGEVEARVRALGLNDSVIFTGVTHDMPQMLSALDDMALPSLHEGLPNVLIEWQASGLRAIVSDAVTPEANLTGRLRYLPLDIHTWAVAMLEAAPTQDRPTESDSAITRIAEAGYDIQENAERLRTLYFEYARAAGAYLPLD